MGKTTKIDWVDATWNPVTGCMHDCKYCYARRIANRFDGFKKNDLYYGESWENIGTDVIPFYEVKERQYRETASEELVYAPYPFGFIPTLHLYKMDEPKGWIGGRDVFVCSMADLFGWWVPDKVIYRVLQACWDAPQHRYFFLTKNPKRYLDLFGDPIARTESENLWFGTTVTEPDTEYFFHSSANCFLSIEPIHGNFPVDERPLREYGIKWMIVGAETGNRVGKIKPEREWVEHIAETCRINDIPLFMKESLHDLMGNDFRQEKP